MSNDGRILALLDVENLLSRGPKTASGCDYQAAVERVAVAAHLVPSTHVVLGFGRNAEGVFGAKAAWPSAAIRCLRGKDGGERALLRYAADHDAISRCYDAVVVGSGDGEFASFAASLAERGVHVCVVSWPDKLSRRLKVAAAEVRSIKIAPARAGDLSHAA